jgi:hypothetical protein
VLFGVGLPRTGTTSLGDACEILGLRRLGWREGRDSRLANHRLMKVWWTGNVGHLVEVASGYDVLVDLPWPLVYAEMADAFPDARFVLTRRSSTDVWLGSQLRHVADRSRYAMSERVYGSADPAHDPGLYRARYETHNAEVRGFFDGTDRLLEVCWEEGDGWPQLCGFLGLPLPDVPFPHSNASGPRRPRPPFTFTRRVRRRYRTLRRHLAGR